MSMRYGKFTALPTRPTGVPSASPTGYPTLSMESLLYAYWHGYYNTHKKHGKLTAMPSSTGQHAKINAAHTMSMRYGKFTTLPTAPTDVPTNAPTGVPSASPTWISYGVPSLYGLLEQIAYSEAWKANGNAIVYWAACKDQRSTWVRSRNWCCIFVVPEPPQLTGNHDLDHYFSICLTYFFLCK